MTQIFDKPMLKLNPAQYYGLQVTPFVQTGMVKKKKKKCIIVVYITCLFLAAFNIISQKSKMIMD